MNETRSRDVIETRNSVVEELRKEVVGPAPGFPAVQTGVGPDSYRGEEILRAEDPPRSRYGAGVLFPRKTRVEEQERVDAPEEEMAEADSGDPEAIDSAEVKAAAASGPSSARGEESDTDLEINRANEFLPSAMGITALLVLPEKLEVHVSAGRYRPEGLPGHQWTDSEGKTHEYRSWWRIPIEEKISIDCDGLQNGGARNYQVPTGDSHLRLRLHVLARPATREAIDSKGRLVTITLLNDTTDGPGDNEDCLFQAGFEVRGSEGEACFLEYPGEPEFEASEVGSRAAQLAREEREELDLLYRKRRVFAVGHGCAPEWDDSLTSQTTKIRTVTLPQYEISPVMPTALPELEFRMARLASDPALALTTAAQLCAQYREWLETLQLQLVDGDLPDRFLSAGRRNIARAEACLERLRDGMELLETNSQAVKAFRLMNRAMLMQQIHSRFSEEPRHWGVKSGTLVLEREYEPPTYEGRGNQWYPFQFAFVLMNLRAIVEPEHHSRGIVDIIWFPTGGGKTEAYLGLAAFAILFRRLSAPSAVGTCVLTRYTLRLLTTQQYQRAASLICALEQLRRNEPEDLGEERFSIGLWVGGAATPNREDNAVKLLNEMYKDGSAENPFVLLSCPWCGAGMGAYQVGKAYDVRGYRKLTHPARVRHICSDPACEFSDSTGLPVLVTDEAMYADPPTMIVGTVDKFALLPWYPAAQAFFGREGGEQVRRPPDLIIQDELHLISGPLGSMVGHYESVITELCSGEHGIVKVVASTATIARAHEQVKGLYGRSESALFPPQGLEWGSSFFAEERRDLPGRIYLGVFTPALPSSQTSLIRVYSALLEAPRLASAMDPSVLDPYWTLIGYFNSIRELGSAATLVSADIREYMRVIFNRKGLGPRWRMDEDPDLRRWLRGPTLELTSRVSGGRITETLQALFAPYNGDLGSAVDVCLATNMIQVGLDVRRLGLMVVAGQPKTTSEYIQATSRVGRSDPGLAVVLLNAMKPRDRSHFEHFRAFHERIYSSVEPTSVTPFAIPVRERALHALIVTLVRYWSPGPLSQRPDEPIDEALIAAITDKLMDRVKRVDPEEAESTRLGIERIVDQWQRVRPARYGDFSRPDEELPLMYPFGSEPRNEWQTSTRQPPWPTPSSMRNVDATCELRVLANYASQEGE